MSSRPLEIGRLESRLTVYRESATRGALGSVQTTWTEAGGLWASFRPEYQTLRNYGAGEMPEGMRELEIHAGSDLHARDAFAVIAGPQSGTRWRVIHVDEATRDRRRVRAEPLTATLP
jgi:head-tail adaptor